MHFFADIKVWYWVGKKVLQHTALVNRRTFYFNSKRLYSNVSSLCVYNSLISISQFFIVCSLFPAGLRFDSKKYITRRKILISMGYRWIKNYFIPERSAHISCCGSWKMPLQELVIRIRPKCPLIHFCSYYLRGTTESFLYPAAWKVLD